MKTLSKKCNSGQTHKTSNFFPYRKNQWQFSQTDGSSYCLRRRTCDYELLIDVHRVPYSFLVCPMPQQSSAVSPEQDNGKQQKLWSQKCERQNFPIVKSSVRYQTQHILLSSERLSALDMGELYKNLKGPGEICSEAGNHKLRSTVLSHRQLIGALLEKAEEKKISYNCF